MRIPESHTEYWELSREERKRLFEEYGISHRMMPTAEERAVLVYMYRNPGASHQEIGDELGINRRTVSRIIQRLGKKLAHHIEE